MKLNTGLMSAAAVLIAMTAVAAPQSGGSGGSSGSSGASSSASGGAMGGSSGSMGGSSGGSSGSTGGSSGAMGGTSGGSSGGMHGSQHGSTSGSSGSMSGSSSGSMQGSSSSRMGSSMGASAGGTLTSEERKFVMEAASAGMLEIQAGRMAAQQARDPQAKAYAERMVQEHTQNAQKLTSIAQANGITPPEKLMPKHQAMLDKLQRAKGSEFDQAYGKLMDASHKDTVQAFERAQRTVQNPQLAAYVQESLPVLQDHHADAKQLPGSQSSRQAMGGSSESGSSMSGSSSQGGSSMGGSTQRGPSASDQKGMPDNTNGRERSQRESDRETSGQP